MGTDHRSASGLEGVVVADTAQSEVDGAHGRLILHGHDVGTLAGHVSFEDVVGLFLDGALPDAAGRAAMGEALGRARQEAFERIGRLGGALDLGDGMAALRAAVAHLDDGDDGRGEAIRIVGAAATYAAAWSRRRGGLALVPPRRDLGHAADYLCMVRGEVAPDAHANALDAYLCTVVDHGLNASTFTARVVASTGASLLSAVVAAIGALSGPLHGGAPGPVLDMLDAVGEANRARTWLQAELDAGRRIMGMGHRIYRVRDPRAAVLEEAVARLGGDAGQSARLTLARAVEQEAEALLAARHPERALRANVEFFTAVLLEAVGLPRALFSPTFAASRVIGWCAHVFEQRAVGRLIRPTSRYVGERPSP